MPPMADPTAIPAMAPVDKPLPEDAGSAVCDDDESVSAEVIGDKEDVNVEVPTTMTAEAWPGRSKTPRSERGKN